MVGQGTKTNVASEQGAQNNFIHSPAVATGNNPGTGSAFTIEIPSLSLPKGGGAIKSIDEKFSVNAVNGSVALSIPLPSTSARGFGASPELSYNSGAGNGVFGMGWTLSLPSIRRKTDKQLPQYHDADDSDIFLFAGAEDLVPVFQKSGANWIRDEQDSPDGIFSIQRYRPRIESGFARIERWTQKNTGVIHWKVISRDNVTSLFGTSPASTITDPADPRRIFEWFLQFTYDDKGNCVLYEYKIEDADGINTALLHNRNRSNGNTTFTNTYLKRVRSGNITAYHPGDPQPASTDFLFETLFDYGEHDPLVPPFAVIQPWTFRVDAFSDYRAGFEIRTCRLCKRVFVIHHFPELPGGSALVSSVQFSYDDNGQTGNLSFLKSYTSTGYIKQADHSYSQQQLPPFTFSYQPHEWNTTLQVLSPASSVHAPAGINPPVYQWVDLYSEGLPGILTEQGGGLYYKHNYGDGQFAPATLVSPRPSLAGATFQLQELEANGSKYLASYTGSNKGFYKITDEGGWESFTAFEQLPTIDFTDPHTRMIDLNGDGKPELLITDDNLFTWYPSLGEKGFSPGRNVWQDLDEEKGPRLLFNDTEQSVFLSDLNGDGLTDIVRIKNGSVCYWPNLGYGKFGAKVSMDHAPVFDHHGSFDASLIKLADIDGSGTTDLIYTGHNNIEIWLNLNGNGFTAEPIVLELFPGLHSLSQLAVTDLLGNGTACLTWSSTLPNDHQQPLRYVDLMNSKKPHLLTGYKNNMGKEVEFHYKASTHFYIQDKLAGTPWVTKLPFPVHCLQTVVRYDRILKVRFASEYSYHHGYYDHAEREFRGFGRVDQRDSEDIAHFIQQGNGAFNTTIQKDLHQDPVLIKTWFHTGAFIDQERVLNQYAHEYKANSVHPENLLAEPVLPAGLTIEEWRQALRACKGRMLRKEMYALDKSLQQDNPYTVEQQHFLVKLLQPQLDNLFASFIVLNSEEIAYQYERDLSDPRVIHSFILETDEYANVTKAVSLVYPRKVPQFPEQGRCYASYTENQFTNPVHTLTDHRTPLLYATRLFEVTGLSAPTATYYTVSEIRTACLAASPITYDKDPDGSLQKRLLDHSYVLFRADDGVTVLPPGSIASKVLFHQAYKAAFTASQLTALFSAKMSFVQLANLLTDPQQGGYLFSDNYFWIPSATPAYDPAHFFLPVSFADAFGQVTRIQYDAKYHLFTQKISNPLGHEIVVREFNYRVLQPWLLEDINGNLSAARFDAFGVPVMTFVLGKPGTDAGDEIDMSSTEISAADFPSTQLEYHLFEWYDQSTSPGFDPSSYKPRPNSILTKVRETHYHQDPLHQTKMQEIYSYFGGSGQEILKKVQAEPGMALQVNPDGSTSSVNTFPLVRWVGNGRTILNNKGKPVKQYEPYFSVSPGFDDEKEMVELGVTPLIHYDPTGRAIRTDLPNKAFTKIEFNPWSQRSFDANDTLDQSDWYTFRILTPDPAIASPDQISAAQKAFLHAQTPSISHLDPLGRIFFTEADTGTEKISSHLRLDPEGKPLAVTDALNRVAMQYDYDMLGRSTRQVSMDAGTRWMLHDAGNSSLLSWDSRDHEFSYAYDALRRPVSTSVKTGMAAAIITSRMEYGESLSPAAAKTNNLLGKAYKSYDQSGITTNLRYDFKGNLLEGAKQFAQDYKGMIDWTTVAAVALSPEIFLSAMRFDAINRPLSMVTPHSATMQPCEIFPLFNEANLLKKVDVSIKGAATVTNFVSRISYDAKGQREEIIYGNGTKTTYRYERDTLRLQRLTTTRDNGATLLQDLHYSYDPAGNICRCREEAQATVFFDGEQVADLNDYTYNAIYQLVKASGRKHAGQTDLRTGNQLSSPLHSRNHPFVASSSINPNDAAAFRNYTERYSYDKAGNMLEQKHTAKDSGWTRTFTYDQNNNLNNRLTSTSFGGDDYQYHYDAHGNMHGLESITGELWDFLDQFKEADLGGGGTAYYVYDGGGQRVRKVIERPNGNRLERIYLGGIEIYREFRANGTVSLERETIMVTDDHRRIAMIDIPVIQPQGNNEVQLIRYQYDNHLGSASLELDAAGAIISYEEYFPFGTTSFSTIDATREVAAKRYRYTGKERDEETGLNYHGARYYALWLCRWTASDPVGINAGLNTYTYVSNNPVLFNDPSGTAECPPGPTVCAAEKEKDKKPKSKEDVAAEQFATDMAARIKKSIDREPSIGREERWLIIKTLIDMGDIKFNPEDTTAMLRMRLSGLQNEAFLKSLRDEEKRRKTTVVMGSDGYIGSIEDVERHDMGRYLAIKPGFVTAMVQIQGGSIDDLERAQQADQVVMGLLTGVAGIGSGQAQFQAVKGSPANNPGKPVPAEVRPASGGTTPSTPAPPAPPPPSTPPPPAAPLPRMSPRAILQMYAFEANAKLEVTLRDTGQPRESFGPMLPMMKGRAMEAEVQTMVQSNPVTRQMFLHLGGANQPDWIPNTPQGNQYNFTVNINFDLFPLNQRQVDAHLSRPYGPTMVPIYYLNPPPGH